jgi:hypothetical protein
MIPDWQEYAAATNDLAEVKEFFEPNLYLYDGYRAGSDSASRSIAFTNCFCGGRASSSVCVPASKGVHRASGPAGE